MPLSYAQSRLWFLEQLSPGVAGYNVSGALRLRGRLDVTVLQRAVEEVVRRHEALRTTFEEVGGEPVQRIHPRVDVSLPVEDLSSAAEATREERAREIAREEATRSFDLARGPLLRTRLLRIGPEDHELVLTMHHIVSDGWSVGVLIREISALYEAFGRDEPSPLAPLPIQYADYAVWQRESLSSEQLDAQLDYWRTHLETMPLVLELPADRPHPPTRTFNGATLARTTSADVKRAVHEVGRRAGATEFMTLLAIFGVLLSRYSGQKELVIGTPIANRTRRETEGLIGFFVNTLALGLRIDRDASFETLLADVKSRALGAYAHQDLPFEQLVNALQVERAMSRSPVFQVMFVLQNAPAAELRLPGLEITPHEIAGGVANFELTLVVTPSSDGYALQWEYNTDLFDAATIERMATHFEVLLDAATRQPERSVMELPLLTAEERRWITVELNDTRSAPRHDALVHELFEAQVDRSPDAPALVFEGRTSSYRELDALANRIAHRLRRLGVGREDRVAVFMLRSIELVATLLGVLKAGGAYVPIDPTYPPERVAYMLSDSGARVIVTQSAIRDQLGATEAAVLEADADDPTESSERPSAALHPSSAVYVIYTSGSTGRPKGVVNAHQGVANRLQWMKPALGVDDSDVFLQKTPFTFDVSVWELFVPLVIGAQLVVARPEGHKDTAYLCDLVEEAGVTTMHFVPSMLEPFLDEPKLGKCASVRRVVCSGEALAYATTRRFHQRMDAELYNLYGPTETSIEVTWWQSDPEDPGPVVPIGRPITNVQTYILDAELQPVPVGVHGELHLGGVQVARGYGGRPGLTAERFVPDPFAPGRRLYKTGDLARWRPDGAIEYLGRLDHQVKVRGFRIELGEIETVLSSLDEVRDVVVVAREDAPGDTRLVAYLVATDPDDLDASRLRERLEAKLPDYMVPSAFVTLDVLPLTASGKVDRCALPRPRIDRAAAPQGPLDPIDERLCAIFAEVLGVPRVGVHDDFFELGGHSLLAIRLVSRVRDELGFDVALREVFDCPTVAMFKARMVAGPSGTGARPISRRTTSGDLPLSPSQLRHWRYAQTNGGSSAFAVRAALRLRGRLDVDALRRALDEVVRRHESLRTTFHDVDGVLIQRVHDTIDLDFAVQDLGALSRSELGAREPVLVKEASDCPFDLANGPTLRIRLLRLGETEHILVYTVHHIAFDGWSGRVLTEEMLALYAAHVEGRPSPLPEPTIHYADYAAWRHERMHGAPLREQLEYWMSQLRGMPLRVELPTDRPLSVPRRFKGALLGRRLDPEARRAVSGVGRTAGVTEFMALLAALGVFLSDVTGQRSTAVVSPIAGRRHPDAFRLVGYFVNWLPHLVHVRPDESFLGLLRRVREQTLGAYMHQDLPFEMILEALDLDPDPSIRRELQIVFAVEYLPDARPQLAGLETEPVAVRSGVAKFDLALFVLLSEHGFELVWEYDRDQFDEATMVRLAERFEQILRLLLASPAEPIERLPLEPSSARETQSGGS
ncbi:MAG: amino acid adenylation domain-containing protein [Myxococcales bacterium]|nr:amino acid adenylation domain-containing protein [Myxococcales bacterium]